MLPDKQQLVNFRAKLVSFFVLWIGLVQGLLFLLIFSLSKNLVQTDWLKHEPLIVGIEMLLFQFICHRAFFLSWWLPAPPLTVTMRAEMAGNAVDLSARQDVLENIELVKARFTVPIAQMQSVVSKTAAPRQVGGLQGDADADASSSEDAEGAGTDASSALGSRNAGGADGIHSTIARIAFKTTEL